MADTPLELHWITYRGLASDAYGKQGWATVWGKGVEGGDYIYYGQFNGKNDTGFSQALYQARLSNAKFGGNVVVHYGNGESRTIYPYESYERVRKQEPEQVQFNNCLKYCPICWLFRA